MLAIPLTEDINTKRNHPLLLLTLILSPVPFQSMASWEDSGNFPGGWTRPICLLVDGIGHYVVCLNRTIHGISKSEGEQHQNASRLWCSKIASPESVG